MMRDGAPPRRRRPREPRDASVRVHAPRQDRRTGRARCDARQAARRSGRAGRTARPSRPALASVARSLHNRAPRRGMRAAPSAPRRRRIPAGRTAPSGLRPWPRCRSRRRAAARRQSGENARSAGHVRGEARPAGARTEQRQDSRRRRPAPAPLPQAGLARRLSRDGAENLGGSRIAGSLARSRPRRSIIVARPRRPGSSGSSGSVARIHRDLAGQPEVDEVLRHQHARRGVSRGIMVAQPFSLNPGHAGVGGLPISARNAAGGSARIRRRGRPSACRSTAAPFRASASGLVDQHRPCICPQAQTAAIRWPRLDGREHLPGRVDDAAPPVDRPLFGPAEGWHDLLMVGAAIVRNRRRRRPAPHGRCRFRRRWKESDRGPSDSLPTAWSALQRLLQAVDLPAA